MKWINATKYVTAERKLGGIIYASGCKALWWFYLLRIKFLYSPKSPLYRADAVTVCFGLIFSGLSFFTLACSVSVISQFTEFVCGHTSSSTEIIVAPPQIDATPKVSDVTTIPPQTDPIPKVSSARSNNSGFSLIKTPPEDYKFMYYTYTTLLIISFGCLYAGFFFLGVHDILNYPQTHPLPHSPFQAGYILAEVNGKVGQDGIPYNPFIPD